MYTADDDDDDIVLILVVVFVVVCVFVCAVDDLAHPAAAEGASAAYAQMIAGQRATQRRSEIRASILYVEVCARLYGLNCECVCVSLHVI